MKKYVKPELFYERYELSQHIADCAWELQANSDTSCHAEPDDNDYPGFSNLFHAQQIGCVMTTDQWQDYCYTNGAEGYNLFKS